jgi:hypothetical protein
MEERPNRNLGQRVVHAACGACLGALAALPAVVWWLEIHWSIVGVCALLGLLMGWFFGDEAITFLARLWWW